MEVSIGRMDLMAGGISFGVLALLWVFLYRTKWGLGIRASSIDILTASLMGINNNAVAIIVFAITGVLSSVAGVFLRHQVRRLPDDGRSSPSKP